MLITVENLSHTFGDKKLYEKVSFRVLRGENWFDRSKWNRKNHSHKNIRRRCWRVLMKDQLPLILISRLVRSIC